MDMQADPTTARGARARVAQQLEETLRNWVEREQIDTGMKPGVTTADQQRINELERENRELGSRTRFKESTVRPPALTEDNAARASLH